jgi:hypothetical protein
MKIAVYFEFFQAKSVADSYEIITDKFVNIQARKPENQMNVFLGRPSIARFSCAAIAIAVLTGSGVKAEIKSSFSYDVHQVLLLKGTQHISATAS